MGYHPGPVLSNADALIHTYGRGGHGARPETTVDPVVIAVARTVLALQTIVARAELSPFDPAVITVGSIHGGTKNNIIPDEVVLQLTVRLPRRCDNTLLSAIDRIVKVAVAAGAPRGVPR